MKIKRKHTTANAIFIRDGQALLAQRRADKKNYAGLWDIPGGHLKKGETPEQALLREIDEELGVSISAFQPYASYDEIDPTSQKLYRHHVFIVTKWQGEPQNCAPQEHAALGWFSAEQINTLALTPSTHRDLSQLLTSLPLAQTSTACKLCADLNGVAFSTAYWQVVVNRNQNYLGKTFLVLKRHIEDPWQMSAAEWDELRPLAARLRLALIQLFQPDHFNYAFLQNQDAHVHLHIIPRYATKRVFNGQFFSDGQLGMHYNLNIEPVDAETFETLRATLSQVLEKV